MAITPDQTARLQEQKHVAKGVMTSVEQERAKADTRVQVRT